jgi:hypothetical protein
MEADVASHTLVSIYEITPHTPEERKFSLMMIMIIIIVIIIREYSTQGNDEK